MSDASKTPGHELRDISTGAGLDTFSWVCECGAWSIARTPPADRDGKTDVKSRVNEVKRQHAEHVAAVTGGAS